jgi:toxin YoeB
VLNLEFSRKGFEDFAWWIENDKKMTSRIIKLLYAARATPFGGIGKPEALKYDLRGCWSLRIDDFHRLVYEVFDDRIKIHAYRYHYDK